MFKLRTISDISGFIALQIGKSEDSTQREAPSNEATTFNTGDMDEDDEDMDQVIVHLCCPLLPNRDSCALGYHDA